MAKIGFVSLGCPKNLVDSEVMIGLAQEAGHELTSRAEDADVIVVNTCAFIDRAKQESVDAILELARHKATGPCRRLVVTGCLAERYRDELVREMPEIDAVLGTGEVPRIVDAVEGVDRPASAALMQASPLTFHRGSAAPVSAPRPAGAVVPRLLPTYIYDADTPRTLTTPRHYAYVKIAEGCDYKCAFCIIPTLRGKYRSRPLDSVVAEAEALAARGIRELILISQDTTFYGVDRRERGALARLLRRLNALPGIEWIRLLYLYPTTIDSSVLEAMAECEKLCRYIDLPLQHASDAVLRRMKRPGTRRGYERLLDHIRATVPGVALRTTFIVGFPGETARDFDELLDFARAIEFDHVGVFTYSHEEGTSAHTLADDVPGRVKRARQKRLLTLQKQLVRRAQQRRVGEATRVMVDGPSPEHDLVLTGRLASQAPDIDSCVYLTDCDSTAYRAGDLIEARIVGARDYDLVARPLP
jgi:ribosomal protein S12 methylthiotransferase